MPNEVGRLECFLPRPESIPSVYRICSGNREKRQYCIKAPLKIDKLNKTTDSRESRKKSSGTSHRRQVVVADPSYSPCRYPNPSRQLKLPAPKNHWASVPTDSEGQLTANLEKSVFSNPTYGPVDLSSTDLKPTRL